MAKNHDAVGEWIYPCKQKTKPTVKGAGITCACPTLDAEVGVAGHYFCKLSFEI